MCNLCDEKNKQTKTKQALSNTSARGHHSESKVTQKTEESTFHDNDNGNDGGNIM